MGEIRCPHCETEIDEHKANRCLDAWVAEAVMIEKVNWMDTEGDIIRLRPYSTDIAAAWEVVGHFSEKQYHVEVWEEDGFDWSSARCRTWSPVDNFNDDEPVGRGWDETRDWKPGRASSPLAICRAALKAGGD